MTSINVKRSRPSAIAFPVNKARTSKVKSSDVSKSDFSASVRCEYFNSQTREFRYTGVLLFRYIYISQPLVLYHSLMSLRPVSARLLASFLPVPTTFGLARTS